MAVADVGSGGQAKKYDRRCTPVRPMVCVARRVDEPPQPAHRARRVSKGIITGPANHRNRQFARKPPPIAPFVKIWQAVASKQPDEPVLGMPPLELNHGVDRKPCPSARFEITDFDPRSARQRPSGTHACFERRHVYGALLQRIAGRDQPPDFVEL